ncbi:MAG: acyl-CoA thioesterase [Anaerolineae bacterium]|jgi:acyl-CoA thioester hydrolase|nr:acyl-CoA thioesterase [Anaerolineae bacterium]
MTYHHHVPIAIRYGDMDTLGHVNNSKYLTYLEQARIQYFHDHGLWDGSISSTGMIVARVTLDYKAPMTVHDRIAHVWTRVSRLGNSSFDMEHQISVERHGENVTTAIGTIVIVVFDYEANQSKAIPQAWRDRLTTYEGLS